jgi:uncharacterized membrane protein
VTPLKKTDRVLFMKEDIKLRQLHQDVFTKALKLSENYPQQMVAATYMAIAMRLYRTSLAENEYARLMNYIMETDVKPFDIPTLH